MMRLLLAWTLLCGALLPPIASLAQFGVPADFAIVMAKVTPPTTWNPAAKGADITLSGGNLSIATGAATSWESIRTIASESTGKWYVELSITGGSNWVVGICDGSAGLASFVGADVHGYGLNILGRVVNNGAPVITGYPPYSSGHVVGLAVDFGGQLAWWRVDGGVWNAGGGADPATGTGGFSISTGPSAPYFIGASLFDAGDTLTANFGATAMSFTVPAGFTSGFH